MDFEETKELSEVDEQIDRRFPFSSLPIVHKRRMDEIIGYTRTLAIEIKTKTWPGYEQEEALKNLEQCLFWARLAISRYE